jgi:hypothetical protein
MNRAEVVAHPSLQDLPFKIELKEVWICDEYGSVKFYDESGELEQSKMFPDFPLKVSYK